MIGQATYLELLVSLVVPITVIATLRWRAKAMLANWSLASGRSTKL